MTAGNPLLPGATPVPGGVNFSVGSPARGPLSLVLLDPVTGAETGSIRFPRRYRVGDVHTMTVLGLRPGAFDYGYRAPGTGLLLDPYARLLHGGETWGRRPAYRCAVPAEPFDWQGDTPPRIPAEDLVVYELHVRGFTRHPSSGVAHPGTYAGLAEKIPYLLDLGVNCVELMPTAEFDETDNPVPVPAGRPPLADYWGYNPVGFFAPKAGYAADAHGEGPVRELKTLVRSLHRAGIQVLLDVVLNHTAEGDERGPTLSLRGLHDQAYYSHAEDGSYRNLTRTGNTVNANHPVTRALLLDCLRHWATEYHVDGFRFDMAPILARGPDGALLANPPLLEAIAHDPVLAGRKLIAEPFDADGLDLVGRFPSYGRWAEWNPGFTYALRRFLTGTPGSAGDLADRLVGSPDTYGHRGLTAGVNFADCHDGFTLADWASYDRPHNEANGEGGIDGPQDNASWNCGAEGPTDDPDVLRLRARQVRTALLLVLTAHGTPMLAAGCELGRTQRGNNNTYCQDNEINWLDWTALDRDPSLHHFVRACLAYRRAHRALRRDTVPEDAATGPGRLPYPRLSWHGRRPWQPDWSAQSRLVVLLHHEPADDEGRPDDTVLVAVNSASQPVAVDLPPPPPGTRWHTFADTAMEPGHEAHAPGTEPALPAGAPVLLADHSAIVLTALPQERREKE
ncbi:glycogen debranching protein [Streptomyces sp. CA-111067]|uniref:glycogen debranching protein n=1 Tax=Streptomyces sp. CA-111067 TaxID=3240046 RepID=UPI003D95D071